MCDACRWSNHDHCAGYLADGRRLRCLCRDCLPMPAQERALSVEQPVVLTLVVDPGREWVPTPTADRPRLRLLRGGA